MSRQAGSLTAGRVVPLAVSDGCCFCCWSTKLRKNCVSHIDASQSRQPLVKGERLVRHEVNAVMASFETM